MSRGIPGYPGGLPRGSAGEAGPVPPRPLHPRGPPTEGADAYFCPAGKVIQLCTFAHSRRLL